MGGCGIRALPRHGTDKQTSSHAVPNRSHPLTRHALVRAEDGSQADAGQRKDNRHTPGGGGLADVSDVGSRLQDRVGLGLG